MFKKLLGNLPFNPSLLGQLSFYAKRVHQEERLRRLGLVMTILAVLVQMFAIIVPPEPTMARSSNDIIPGGFAKKETALEHCRQNRYDFKTVLNHFGVSCKQLADATVKNVRSTAHDRSLLSIGRLPYGKKGERAVTIDGKKYYQRYLWSWDSGPYSTYKALVGKTDKGKPFMVLFNCGNITIPEPKDTPKPKPKPKRPLERPPVPETPVKQEDECPDIPGKQTSKTECKPCEEAEDNDATACVELSKTAANETQNISKADGTQAAAGDVITYTLSVKNTGKITVAGFIVEENIADILDYATVIDAHGGKVDDASFMTWAPTDIKPNATITKKLTIKIKDPIPSTPQSASNAGTFDLTITNVYGNTVNITLPPSLTKSTEQVVQTLPSTGPGETLVAAMAGTTMVGYFFARSRLFAKELDIVKTDYATTGGY